MGKIDIYSKGLIYCSVCADKAMNKNEVETEVNLINPTGISSLWKISGTKFRDGADNPHQCEHSQDRQHWLLSC